MKNDRKKSKSNKSRKRKDRSDHDDPVEQPEKLPTVKTLINTEVFQKAKTTEDEASIQAPAAHSTVADPEEPPEKKRRAMATMMAPMSREQYEKEQSVVREVYDEESGRWRLVRGSGEIIERMVSRDDHQRINHRATQGDGSSFSKHIYGALQQRR